MKKALAKMKDRTGYATGLRGNVSGLTGNATSLTGDIDLCELTAEDRAAGVNIDDLIA